MWFIWHSKKIYINTHVLHFCLLLKSDKGKKLVRMWPVHTAKLTLWFLKVFYFKYMYMYILFDETTVSLVTQTTNIFALLEWNKKNSFIVLPFVYTFIKLVIKYWWNNIHIEVHFIWANFEICWVFKNFHIAIKLNYFTGKLQHKYEIKDKLN